MKQAKLNMINVDININWDTKTTMASSISGVIQPLTLIGDERLRYPDFSKIKDELKTDIGNGNLLHRYDAKKVSVLHDVCLSYTGGKSFTLNPTYSNCFVMQVLDQNTIVLLMALRVTDEKEIAVPTWFKGE